MNLRRKLLFSLGAGALAAAFASLAQHQVKVWRVGFLTAGRPAALDSSGAFRQGMRELGYVEGKNLVIEWRFADGKVGRLPGLAAELVQLKLDVIVAGGTPVTSVVREATAAIPIVMVNVADPVDSGFIKALARPGGNITGTSSLTSELSPKERPTKFALLINGKTAKALSLTIPQSLLIQANEVIQ